jgi:3-phenylpropionate/trans-cinnamate dioxygenase ferredoxin subunit
VKLVARVPRRELEEGKLVRLDYAPFDVVVSLVDGVPYAIEDVCNHAGASLAEGGIEGDRVMCPMHGYVFSMRSGALLAPLGLCGPQRTYRAVIEGDDVVIYDDFHLVVI